MQELHLFFYKQEQSKYIFMIPDSDFCIVYSANSEPKFAIGELFCNIESNCYVPEIWNDKTEEEFFQSSLIWDTKFDMNTARYIQKSILQCKNLDDKNVLTVKFED